MIRWGGVYIYIYIYIYGASMQYGYLFIAAVQPRTSPPAPPARCLAPARRLAPATAHPSIQIQPSPSARNGSSWRNGPMLLGGWFAGEAGSPAWLDRWVTARLGGEASGEAWAGLGRARRR
ncbi:hypothetical protein FH972_008604 [Carpinus fangiana]|uniref:Uncharacterized protein n=1 Tax=Carpinus fangiana TaxID=176857 RepID=A0A5N6R208_9ROSI|nr:hypothetical protein FH972_008604 [Carpinus fangiana]